MHDIALILGSGWTFDGGEVIDHFNLSKVAGHDNAVRSVQLANGKSLLIIPRHHYYEDGDVQKVAYPISYAYEQGCSTIILTNAAGAIAPEFTPGSVVAITDHINFTGTTTAQAFTDMSKAYTPELIDLVRDIEPRIQTGVYAQFRGPQYETPAEINMARTVGADLAGMSTALETIMAKELGMKVLALSLISNYAAGITKFPITHEEVLAIGAEKKHYLNALLTQIVEAI